MKMAALICIRNQPPCRSLSEPRPASSPLWRSSRVEPHLGRIPDSCEPDPSSPQQPFASLAIRRASPVEPTSLLREPRSVKLPRAQIYSLPYSTVLDLPSPWHPSRADAIYFTSNFTNFTLLTMSRCHYWAWCSYCFFFWQVNLEDKCLMVWVNYDHFMLRYTGVNFFVWNIF